MTYVTLIERAAKAEGHVEGQANLLLGMVQRRFGPLPDDITQRIRTAKAAQLTGGRQDVWLDADKAS